MMVGIKGKSGGKRPGAGAKPTSTPNKKAKTLNLSLETHAGLVKLKKQHKKSQAVIVETLVRKALKTSSLFD